MAATVIYNAHPGWRTLQQLQGAVSTVSSALSRRRDLKKQDETRAIEMATRLMQQDPQMAHTVGEDLIQRYGEKNPFVHALVKGFKTQGASFDAQAAPYQLFQQNANQIQVGRQQELSDAMAMPDEISIAPFLPPVPNQEKAQRVQAAQQALGNQETLFQDAMNQLTPEEMTQAHQHATLNDLPFPEINLLETYDRNKLPATTYGADAAARGDIATPQGREAAYSDAGLTETKAAVSARGAKQANTLEVQGRKEAESQRSRQGQVDLAAFQRGTADIKHGASKELETLKQGGRVERAGTDELPENFIDTSILTGEPSTQFRKAKNQVIDAGRLKALGYETGSALQIDMQTRYRELVTVQNYSKEDALSMIFQRLNEALQR